MKNTSFLIVSFMIFGFNVALSSNIYFVYFLPILFLSVVNLKNLVLIFKKLLMLNFFILAIVLSLMVFKDYQNAILIFIRSNLILSFLLLAFHEISEFEIASSFANLKFGNKISSLFYFTAKFIYIIKQTFFRLKKTLKSRGFKPYFCIFTYKTYGNLVAMLFLNAFYKSNMFEKTMLARGYNGNLYGLKKEFSISKYEIIFAILIFISLFLKKGVLI